MPTHRSGRSAESRTPPTAIARTNRAAPSHADWTSPRGAGAPNTIAGSARTGSANSVAELMNVVAVRPVPIVVGSSPDPTSSRYWIAAPAAAPPGTIRLNAFPEICAVAIANHFPVRSARRCSAHAHAKLAISATNITTNHAGLIVSRSGHAAKTFSSDGHNTYSVNSVSSRKIARMMMRRRYDVSEGVRPAAGGGGGVGSIPKSVAREKGTSGTSGDGHRMEPRVAWEGLVHAAYASERRRMDRRSADAEVIGRTQADCSGRGDRGVRWSRCVRVAGIRTRRSLRTRRDLSTRDAGRSVGRCPGWLDGAPRAARFDPRWHACLDRQRADPLGWDGG